MLNFVLCDDNLKILNRLEKMLNQLFLKHDYDAQVSFCSNNATEVLSYITSNPVDVLICDIQLNSGNTGISLVQKIRQVNKSIYIIFATGHLEYALIAYKLKTFDYIAKPITQERMEETLIRLFQDIESAPEQYLALDKNKIIKQEAIQFIEKNGMKLVVYTDCGKYETYSSFNAIIPSLPSNFVRCHKSFIANINNVKDIQTNTIKFDNMQCYIGPKYKENFMEVLNNHGFFSYAK